MRIKVRCDVPMADKKGIRKYCDKKCGECLCAIVMDEFGNEKHLADMQSGCGAIVTRNLRHLRGEENDREGTRETKRKVKTPFC